MIAHTELANVARVVQGGRHGLSGNHFVPEGYPAYGAGGLNGYLATYEFDEPAVVLSAIGARCGKCFPASGKWSSLANTQVILPDPAKVDARFLWYQLNDELSWPRAGTAQPFIKPLTVKTRKVYLPPLPEQRRIADILDRADAVRRKRKQAIALTEELLRSTFLEMFGDPVSNPKGWAVKTLDKLVETATGGTPSRDRAENFGGDIPWVKTTEVRDERKSPPKGWPARTVRSVPRAPSSSPCMAKERREAVLRSSGSMPPRTKRAPPSSLRKGLFSRFSGHTYVFPMSGSATSDVEGRSPI